MRNVVAILSLSVLSACAMASPLRADPALAGTHLAVGPAAQPLCADPAQLRAFLLASIAGGTYPLARFPGCAALPQNARVEVIEDLGAGGAMHIVKVRVAEVFGPVESYTYSVGLDPRGPYAQPPLPFD